MKMFTRLLVFVMAGLITHSLAAQQGNAGLVSNPIETQGELDKKAAADGSADAAAIAKKVTQGNVAASAVHTALRSSLDSKDAHVGQVVVATVKQPVTLPDGIVLQKGSTVIGHVALVTAHSKKTPNGGVLLTFDQAKLKDGKVIPVIVMIRALAPSAESQAQTHGMNEGTIGGTGNTPGGAVIQAGGYGTAVIGRNPVESGLPGVSLITSAGGSGALLAAGDNLYLDAGTQMVLVVAHVPEPAQ
jgi:hypothetical protein